MVGIDKRVMEKLEKDKNSASLKISRLPIKTFDFFIKLANEEFCGDYGFTLKWLIDSQFDARIDEIMRVLQEHEKLIKGLLNKPVEEEVKGKTLLNGKVLEVKK
jgi:hypothetical protein